MRTYIRVPDSLRKELASRFKVSRTSVWSALNYLTNGDRPESIRQYALANGGSIEEKSYIPNCRTEYTKYEIIQTFPGGIKIHLDRNEGTVMLMKDNLLLETYGPIPLQAWGNILHRAQELSERAVAEAAKK